MYHRIYAFVAAIRVGLARLHAPWTTDIARECVLQLIDQRLRTRRIGTDCIPYRHGTAVTWNYAMCTRKVHAIVMPGGRQGQFGLPLRKHSCLQPYILPFYAKHEQQLSHVSAGVGSPVKIVFVVFSRSSDTVTTYSLVPCRSASSLLSFSLAFGCVSYHAHNYEILPISMLPWSIYYNQGSHHCETTTAVC